MWADLWVCARARCFYSIEGRTIENHMKFTAAALVT